MCVLVARACSAIQVLDEKDSLVDDLIPSVAQTNDVQVNTRAAAQSQAPHTKDVLRHTSVETRLDAGAPRCSLGSKGPKTPWPGREQSFEARNGMDWTTVCPIARPRPDAARRGRIGSIGEWCRCRHQRVRGCALCHLVRGSLMCGSGIPLRTKNLNCPSGNSMRASHIRTTFGCASGISTESYDQMTCGAP